MMRLHGFLNFIFLVIREKDDLYIYIYIYLYSVTYKPAMQLIIQSAVCQIISSQKFGCQVTLEGLVYQYFPLIQWNKSRYYKKLFFCQKLNSLRLVILLLAHLKQLVASCWILKTKRTSLILDSCFKAHEKLDW